MGNLRELNLVLENNSINDDFVMATGGKGFTMDALSDDILYKQRYWPIIYNQARFPDILNIAIQEAEAKVIELTAIVGSSMTADGKEVSEEGMKKAITSLATDNAEEVDPKLQTFYTENKELATILGRSTEVVNCSFINEAANISPAPKTLTFSITDTFVSNNLSPSVHILPVL